MARSLHLVLLLACLAASPLGALAAKEAVENEDVVPQVVLADNVARGRELLPLLPWARVARYWPSTTPRFRTTTSRYRTTTPWYRTTSLNPRDQSITMGGVYAFDRKLHERDVFTLASTFAVNTATLDVANLPATIHCIQILDQMRTGKNAAVALEAGGVGSNRVSLRFTSQRGEKIYYHVIIWGQ